MIMRLINTCCSRDSNESEMSMVSDDHESMHSLWMYLWINRECTVWVVRVAELLTGIMRDHALDLGCSPAQDSQDEAVGVVNVPRLPVCV